MNENQRPKRRGRPPKTTLPDGSRRKTENRLPSEEFGVARPNQASGAANGQDPSNNVENGRTANGAKAEQPRSTQPRRRGRPAGSKNKPKTPNNAESRGSASNSSSAAQAGGLDRSAQQTQSSAANRQTAGQSAQPTQPKRRGRPVGSKNKPKVPTSNNVENRQNAANGVDNRQNQSNGQNGGKQTAKQYTTIPVQAYHAGPRRTRSGAAEPRPVAQSTASRRVVTANGKLRIIPLGGLLEIGKNVTLYEYGEDIIMVDCGMSFPEDDMYGVDVVMPDLSYLFANKNRVRACFITHGHEDHIGAVSYMCREMNPPIYATPFARGLIEGKLEEANLLNRANLVTIRPGERVRAGCFEVEAINVNHSTPDAVAYAITTPVGVVIQTGDFKIDTTPVAGEMIDLGRFAEYGRQGVLAMLSDSTNVERPGYTMSERTVGETFNTMFQGCNQRIIVTTFASNVHRIIQIAEAAVKVGRKVAISGRSMEKVMQLAVKMGYVDLPAGTLVDINSIHSIVPSKLVIVTTGSQGETLSALSRMANGTHKQVSIGVTDRVIISASPIPGNEGSIARLINDLMRRGADVVYERQNALHVSGHACQEELKLMLGLVKPKFFMPVHGEFKMLRQHARLAMAVGIDQKNIFISENGRVLELTPTSARLAGSVPAGQVLLDGTLGNDVASAVLRDRQAMSEDGVIIVALSVDYRNGIVTAGPEVVARGFALGDNDGALRQMRTIAADAAEEYAYKRDWAALRQVIRARISDHIWKSSKRQPIVLTVLLEG